MTAHQPEETGAVYFPGIQAHTGFLYDVKGIVDFLKPRNHKHVQRHLFEQPRNVTRELLKTFDGSAEIANVPIVVTRVKAKGGFLFVPVIGQVRTAAALINGDPTIVVKEIKRDELANFQKPPGQLPDAAVFTGPKWFASTAFKHHLNF